MERPDDYYQCSSLLAIGFYNGTMERPDDYYQCSSLLAIGFYNGTMERPDDYQCSSLLAIGMLFLHVRSHKKLLYFIVLYGIRSMLGVYV